jgi:hypothetical protein
MDQNPIPVQSLPPQMSPQPGAYNSGPMMGAPQRSHHTARRVAALTSVLLLVSIGLLVWTYSQYLSYKNDIQPKIDVAVDAAVKAKQSELEQSFQLERERLKIPFRTNESIANVSFQYPRDWSQYLVEKESGSIQIDAAFHPGLVREDTIYALRLQVHEESYDDVLSDYQNEIEKGEVRAQPIKISNTPGVRLDGRYDRDREGSLVIFPIRDKTLVLTSESTAYARVYNEILKTLSFTP